MVTNTQEETQITEEILKLQERVKKLEEIKEKDIPNISSMLNDTASVNLDEDKTASKLTPSLLLVTVITMILMTIYEVAKQIISPKITIWESHTITIIFASLIAPLGAYFALKRIEHLRLRAIDELRQRKQLDEKLQDANNKLELRVRERTLQLSDVNESLKKEVTMRREAEEEIRKYAEELLNNKDLLEHKADELYELNKQLSASEKELLAINKSKDKFFSILAHDLRSPFTSLIGLTEFLENEIKTLDEDEVVKIVNSVSTSSKKVYRLLENLLQWSRVQTGKMEFYPENFNLNTLVEDVIELYKTGAEKKNIEIFNTHVNDCYTYADKNMVDTVVRNILSNAIKFTPNSGKISISVSEFNKEIKVCIADTGIGICKKDLKNMFDIDSNSSRPGTDNEKGTGLGLVLCKEFVTKNGGKIWVDSAVNKGSEFSFTLPAAH